MSFRVGSNIRISATVLIDGEVPGVDDPLALVVFEFINPLGATGTMVTTIDDAENGLVHYDIPNEANTMPGTFTIWYRATLVSGAIVVGDPVKLTIKNPGA